MAHQALSDATDSDLEAAVAAIDLWDDTHWDALTRHLEDVRKTGAVSMFPLALVSRAVFATHAGDLTAAASLIAESRWVSDVAGCGELNALAEVTNCGRQARPYGSRPSKPKAPSPRRKSTSRGSWHKD